MIEFLYRADTARSLSLIQKSGFLCNEASRVKGIPMKNESEQAQEDGFKIPSAELIDKPRIYFIDTFENAISFLNRCSFYDFITRYPKNIYPLDQEDLIFVDGLMSDCGAVYCIFPDKEVEDVGIEAQYIELQLQGKWYQLTDLQFTPIAEFDERERQRFKVTKKSKIVYTIGLFYNQIITMISRSSLNQVAIRTLNKLIQ